MKKNFQFSIFNFQTARRGYTLVELIVAVGLFAVIMVLASGAYLLMISLNRQAQGVASGIDNLSFALETMTRTIRTGSAYSCGVDLGRGDCTNGGTSFSFKNADGVEITYRLSGDALVQEMGGGTARAITDPSSVDITALAFYVTGTQKVSAGDYQQPQVTMLVSGSVAYKAGKPPQPFVIETGATMRGSDL